MLSGLTVWLPEVALLPLQAPLAVHDVVLLEDQLRVLMPPLAIDAGLALRLTLGAVALVTVTVVDPEALPPVPVQLKL